MKKNSFDKISEKLINKLNEDALFLTEDDGFADPETIKKQAYKRNVNNAKIETSEAYKKLQDLKRSGAAAPETVKAVTQSHKRGVIKREEEINKQRERNLVMKEDLDQFDDADLYLLAEEFERDISEEVDTKTPAELMVDKRKEELATINAENKNAKTDKETNQAQLQQIKSDAREKINDIKDKQEEQELKQHEDQQKKINDLQKKKEDAEKKLQKAIDVDRFTKEQKTTLVNEEHTMELNENKESRIINKDEKSKKKASNAHVASMACEKKLDEIQAKIKAKRNKGQSVDKLVLKANKIQKKISDLKSTEEKHLSDHAVYDSKIADYEFKKAIKEDANYNEILKELNDLEEELKKTDYPQFTLIEYADPMLNKISRMIKEEYNKEDIDFNKVQILTIKFNQYKN